jgi:hypothetical protein
MLPLRLLRCLDGNISVVDPRSYKVEHFDIISYTWGEEVEPYYCGIDGVNWTVKIPIEKLEGIKRLMETADVQYMWADCVCINQTDEAEKSAEIPKMYQYYKNARMCHVLLGLREVWNPQEIVDNLKFLDHILSHMGGAALASEAMGLSENFKKRLLMWANAEWTFGIEKSIAKSAAIDLGVLNCYSTCIDHVSSLFDNEYFYRVWTFQEMILGKNVAMWGINHEKLSPIGELAVWMDLATDAKDKAYKLQGWIENCRVLKTGAVNAILGIIAEDNLTLNSLQLQVRGINSARADIVTGGPNWWYENYMGINNIFSAVSMTPRKCREKADIFRGLLGVFSGLFTQEEVLRELSGDDMDRISFNFFKQLSLKTGLAWTRLAISSKDRTKWNWIPVIADRSGFLTTDCFAGVVHLGRLKNDQAKAMATTGITGAPRNYMKIRLVQQTTGFQFTFKGCNCGRSVKTGIFSNEPIPTNNQPRDVIRDETGRMLVQCATILGCVMDPGRNVVEYRRRMLTKLQPEWRISDPSAKPMGWINRCVSGTFWENPDPQFIRTHNMSMNYRMVDMIGCGSRLANESTKNVSCEVRVNCGCTILAPFEFILEAITAVEGSRLGETAAFLDRDNRIVQRDGLGLVQVGDVGKTFSLVAFGGDVNSHIAYSSSCRRTKMDRAVVPKLQWPVGRALVREEFTRGMTGMMKDYGYVETGGSGNLLICRSSLLDQYKIVGVCIDSFIPNKSGRCNVTIR